MKQVWIGGIALLAGMILALWLMSEPAVQRTSITEVPSPPQTVESAVPFSELGGHDVGEVIEPPSLANQAADALSDDTQMDIDSATDATSDPSVDAVPILPGIELRGEMRLFHEMLEEEETDYSWAVPMEAELYSYFFDNSQDLADHFGVPSVECRATMCEIQAIGYGDRSLEAWQTATSDLDSQSWAEDIVEVRLGGNPVGPDSVGLVLVLIRASGDATVQAIGESVATI